LNVNNGTVALLLSEEARQVLDFAGVDANDPISVMFYVQDTGDLGVGVRLDREDGSHLILIRWQYVLSMDVTPTPVKSMGFEA
jgi:hypothetical protein